MFFPVSFSDVSHMPCAVHSTLETRFSVLQPAPSVLISPLRHFHFLQNTLAVSCDLWNPHLRGCGKHCVKMVKEVPLSSLKYQRHMPWITKKVKPLTQLWMNQLLCDKEIPTLKMQFFFSCTSSKKSLFVRAESEWYRYKRSRILCAFLVNNYLTGQQIREDLHSQRKLH